MVKGVYAIYDLVAGDVVGNVLTLESSDPPAIRTFRDLMARQDFAAHVADYCLVRVGYVKLDTVEVVDTAPAGVPVISEQHPGRVFSGARVLSERGAPNGE